MNSVIYDMLRGIAIWMVSAVFNILWCKRHSKLVHPDSRPLLIVFAPMITPVIIVGIFCAILYKVPLRLTNTKLKGFE